MKMAPVGGAGVAGLGCVSLGFRVSGFMLTIEDDFAQGAFTLRRDNAVNVGVAVNVLIASFLEDGEGVADLETVGGVGVEELVDSFGRAGKLRIIIVVNDDNSLLHETFLDEAEAGLDGRIEVAIAEGEGYFLWEVLRSKIVKPSFFDDDAKVLRWLTRGGFVTYGGARRCRKKVIRGSKPMFTEFVNYFTLGDKKFTFLKIGASTRGIFPSLLREASERIVKPEVGSMVRLFIRRCSF